jgi:hypothetical protein
MHPDQSAFVKHQPRMSWGTEGDCRTYLTRQVEPREMASYDVLTYGMAISRVSTQARS